LLSFRFAFLCFTVISEALNYDMFFEDLSIFLLFI